ncbi:MAG: GNAT family N-acetyltransferase [Anaerolineales bacterium]|nr:GNAT family N-acetyltransferase [Anaerolineales bacterium]
MITRRLLQRDEIEQIWQIDRREVIDRVYHLEQEELVLEPEHYDMQGWPPGEADLYTPLLYECYDRGGWFYGLFEAERLIGVVILDSKWLGKSRDLLQMKFLHISRDYRGQGLGKELFDLSAVEARARGAKGTYISATPSEHTVNFYLQQGCALAEEPDPELFALEPEDIHLVYDIAD